MGGELQCVGECIVPLGQHGQPIAAIPGVSIHGLKAVLKVVAETPQQSFVGLRMEPSDAVVLFLFLNQAQTAFARFGSKNQNANVHPLIANKVRRVAEHAVGKRAYSRRCIVRFSLGRGFAHGSLPAV